MEKIEAEFICYIKNWEILVNTSYTNGDYLIENALLSREYQVD